MKSAARTHTRLARIQLLLFISFSHFHSHSLVRHTLPLSVWQCEWKGSPIQQSSSRSLTLYPCYLLLCRVGKSFNSFASLPFELETSHKSGTGIGISIIALSSARFGSTRQSPHKVYIARVSGSRLVRCPHSTPYTSVHCVQTSGAQKRTKREARRRSKREEERRA